MQEVCFCGRSGDVRDREPIVDDDGRRALRYLSCGHLEHLEWLSEAASLPVWEEARRRRELSVGQGRHAA